MAKALPRIRRSPLRACREETGLSRDQLARRLPVQLTAHQIYRIEAGISRPSTPTAFALAATLSKLLRRRISAEELFAPPGLRTGPGTRVKPAKRRARRTAQEQESQDDARGIMGDAA